MEQDWEKTIARMAATILSGIEYPDETGDIDRSVRMAFKIVARIRLLRDAVVKPEEV